MPLHPVIADVTERIRTRSADSRGGYLERLDAMAARGPRRTALSCGNLAHAFAACGTHDKDELKGDQALNIGIVTAYNDMLSAHQPYERYPELIRAAARETGAVAQVAGGVPAMCDGVTQGQIGMELSLISRDVIAMATAVALSHDMFDGALMLGICDKIVPGPGHRRPGLRPPADGVRAGRADAHRACPTARRRASASSTPRARSAGRSCSRPRALPTTRPAPVPSTAPPTPTRC